RARQVRRHRADHVGRGEGVVLAGEHQVRDGGQKGTGLRSTCDDLVTVSKTRSSEAFAERSCGAVSDPSPGAA
ncbi:hypothetical protein, partial [Streptomyces aureus]